jgi:hypothetical protein
MTGLCSFHLVPPAGVRCLVVTRRGGQPGAFRKRRPHEVRPMRAGHDCRAGAWGQGGDSPAHRGRPSAIAGWPAQQVPVLAGLCAAAPDDRAIHVSDQACAPMAQTSSAPRRSACHRKRSALSPRHAKRPLRRRAWPRSRNQRPPATQPIAPGRPGWQTLDLLAASKAHHRYAVPQIQPSPQVRETRTSNRRCPSICPSRARNSPVWRSNYVSDLGGAMGIRTPDLLHAMNPSGIP